MFFSNEPVIIRDKNRSMLNKRKISYMTENGDIHERKTSVWEVEETVDMFYDPLEVHKEFEYTNYNDITYAPKLKERYDEDVRQTKQEIQETIAYCEAQLVEYLEGNGWIQGHVEVDMIADLIAQAYQNRGI